MPAPDESFPALRDALSRRYGRPEPPAEGLDPFEAILSVMLDRAVAPRQRDRVLDALREEGLIAPQALAEADPEELDEALRPAGVTAARGALAPLRRLARWVVDLHHGSADELTGPTSPVATAELQDELRSVNGVGPASADAILLFALGRPVYPVDRATYRILARHGWIDRDASYEDARDIVEQLAPADPATLAELSAWFERLGKDHCRASVAKCDRCPLQPFLPEGGPIDPAE